MKSSILYFLLLMLGIPLNLGLDAGHKQSRFPKTLSEKRLKFLSHKGSGTVAFNLSFVLLPAEIDLILKEQDCKKDVLGACGIGYIKMVFALSTEVIALYIEATIVQVEVLGLKWPVSKCGV